MNNFKSSNTSQFRASGNLINGWTTIPNNIMNDMPIMGSDAFTIFAKILQYISNPNHKINVQGLSTQTGLSTGRVSKGLNKLIEIGYITRNVIKDGNLIRGYEYIVYDSPQVREHIEIARGIENRDSDFSDSDFRDANNKNINNKNINNKNIDDEEATPEQQLINLYKSFKLEKRVMPQTLKMLKDNVHISLDVFEQLFINATSKDSTYRYLQEVLKDLNTNNITTLEEFNKHLDARKGKSTKGSNKEKSKTNNKFKNFTETFTNYSENELDKIIDKSQDEKFKTNNTNTNTDNEEDLINKAIELLQAETVLTVNPNDRYWADEIKKKVQELKGL